MNKETTEPYKDRTVWMRGFYMILFMLFMGLAKFVMSVVILFQFLTVLFSAETNEKLLSFGGSLSIYQYQIMMYLTYNSEEQPFPMGDWPFPMGDWPEGPEIPENNSPDVNSSGANSSDV